MSKPIMYFIKFKNKKDYCMLLDERKEIINDILETLQMLDNINIYNLENLLECYEIKYEYIKAKQHLFDSKYIDLEKIAINI